MEKLFFALEIALVSFATVIFALFILYLLLVSLGRLAGGGSLRAGRRNQGAVSAKTKEVAIMMPESSPAEFKSNLDSFNPALVAALSASVYVMIGKNSNKHYRLSLTSPLKTATASQRDWPAEGRKALLEGPEKLAALRRKKSCYASSK